MHVGLGVNQQVTMDESAGFMVVYLNKMAAHVRKEHVASFSLTKSELEAAG